MFPKRVTIRKIEKDKHSNFFCFFCGEFSIPCRVTNHFSPPKRFMDGQIVAFLFFFWRKTSEMTLQNNHDDCTQVPFDN